MKAKKPKLVIRRIVGLTVNAGGPSKPSAYLKYEDEYSDFSVKISYGRAVYALEGFARKNNDGSFRPDLFTTIHAAKLLMTDIEQACLELDEPNNKLLKR